MTKTMTCGAALAFMLGAPPATGAEAGAKKPEATSMNAAEVKFAPAPPDLPKGAEMAVLHGDPTKKVPYTLRLKLPAGYKIPPHWHTRDEGLTIVSGTCALHMGDTMEAPGTVLTAGGFHFLPGKMHHAAEATDETVVQVDGMGPFDIHYLDPADNPNPKASKAAAAPAAAMKK